MDKQWPCFTSTSSSLAGKTKNYTVTSSKQVNNTGSTLYQTDTILTLNLGTNHTAADNHLEHFFVVFQRK